MRITVLTMVTLVSKVFLEQTPQCGPYLNCTCERYRNINKMDCSGRQLSLTKICSFVGQSPELNISSINVANNNYENVSEESLKGCEKITELDLSHNKIVHVHKFTFNNFMNMLFLDLSFNNLEIYEACSSGCFLLPVKLHTLRINGNVKPQNNSKDLNYPKFKPNNHLKKIALDGIADKPVDVFDGHSNGLEELQMSGLDLGFCNISLMTSKTFSAIPEIRVLNISGCDLAKIEVGALSHLSHLEILDVSHNYRLGFRSMENIAHDLQYTNIKVLNYSNVHKPFGAATLIRQRDACFLWNTSLQELVLDGNRIEEIETDALLVFPRSLTVIRVNDNRFRYGLWAFQLGCLSHLTEYYNRAYESAQQRIKDAKTLIEQTAAFYDNCEEKQNISCPFMTDRFFRNRSQLDVNCPFYDSGNISSVPEFLLPQTLTKIDMRHSGLAVRPFVMYLAMYANNVEFIDISDNNLNSLSFNNIIFPLHALKFANLSSNQCTEIGISLLDKATNLTNLELQNNLLGLMFETLKTDSPFRNLQSLIILNVSHNQIKAIPHNLFSSLHNLKTIDLSRNQLDNVHFNFSNMVNLLHLHLCNNFIHCLPMNLLNHIESVSLKRGEEFSIDLRNNSIPVNCKNKEFLEWLVKHKNNMVGYNEYAFVDDTGEFLGIEKFEQLVEGLGKSCTSYTVLVIVCSISFSAILSVVIGAFVYKNRWKIRYFIYMSKAKYFGYEALPNDEQSEDFKYEAFISYAEENLRFIVKEIIPKLEQRGLTLCVHQRDFIAGKPVADNIVDAIRASKRTVVILTKAFLKRQWCMFEFQMARLESIYSRKDRGCLIIVKLESIEGKDMPLEMMNWIRYESYIEYTHDADGNELFWDKLRDAINA